MGWLNRYFYFALFTGAKRYLERIGTGYAYVPASADAFSETSPIQADTKNIIINNRESVTRNRVQMI